MAERQLCDRLAQPLLAMLRQRTRDRQLAEDLTQDTLIVVLTRLREGRIDDLTTLPGFARRTALKLHANWTRKELRRQTDVDSLVVEAVTSAATNPLQQLLEKDRNGLVAQLVREMARPRDREILERLYIWEHDKARICVDMTLRPADVDRIAYRARGRLIALARRRLELDEWGDGSPGPGDP